MNKNDVQVRRTTSDDFNDVMQVETQAFTLVMDLKETRKEPVTFRLIRFPVSMPTIGCTNT
ncbi:MULTISPECIES: hypothetical protein [Parabacteroides]|uniref:Uncharacterized protein n=1 Tax=Myoviridae sp. ctU4n16 TaxID=2826658 RepID=A0A8S5N4I5_9CAUD|nr:hypothetical protein [Parabacteroides goldsteinii]DAD89553.1 MAG TPA: hypothetical protein [Myoviridae sp. ctU4n16]